MIMIGLSWEIIFLKHKGLVNNLECYNYRENSTEILIE